MYARMCNRTGAPVTAMSPEDAVAHVIATDPLFAVTQTQVGGVTMKAFANVPPTVPALLSASREKQGAGQAEFLVYRDERLSYDAFCAEVNRMAHVLRDEFGMGKGDRVALAMRNYPELLVMMLATASIGAVTVFLNAWWTTDELEFALSDSGARVVFADGPRLDRLLPLRDRLSLDIVGVRDGETAANRAYTALRDAAASDAPVEVDLDTDDDFAIMYSSGTTGHPKGVVQTHRGVVNAVFSWLMQAVTGPLVTPPAPDAPPAPRPSALVVTPLFHVTATHPLFLLGIPAGAKITMMHKWDAAEAVRLIRDEEVTRFLGVPTQSAELMAAARDMQIALPTLEYLGAGGAKRPAAQVALLAETFPNAGIATGWGMTETNALGIGMIGDDYKARPNAAGKLYPPVQELRIVDDAGNEVPTGALGEITVKSPANMRCYLNQPVATAEALRDGWLHTGDLGMIDAEGYVTILDRKKNIIIRGGENISCLDVEGALHRHPDVVEACAFSVPDDRLGEVVGAAVHLRPGASPTEEEMRAFLAQHIAAFKIPERYWWRHDALPRAATDKTDRRALRRDCLAAAGMTP